VTRFFGQFIITCFYRLHPEQTSPYPFNLSLVRWSL
jgi:hypothetical protein